jgi:hypothetical protein
LANKNNEDARDPPKNLGDILEDRRDWTSEVGIGFRVLGF